MFNTELLADVMLLLMFVAVVLALAAVASLAFAAMAHALVARLCT